MNINKPKKIYRWVLLRHIGALNDLRGIHFDLLLEDRECCRTWRLSNIPFLDGPYVESFYLSPHNLDWLDIKEKVLSGNRGVATRIKKGTFSQSLPVIQNRYINLLIKWEADEVNLVIDKKGFRIFKRK